MRNRWRQVLLDLAVGAVIMAAVTLLGVGQSHGLLRALCDGAFVAAVMQLGVSGIALARNKGTFDVAGYGVKTVLETALPFLRSPDREKETILEYKERKEKSRKSPRALAVSGNVYLALAGLFLILYSVAA